MNDFLWPSPKIERARKHLGDFDEICAEFADTQADRIVQHRKSHQGSIRTFKFDAPPSLLSLIFGDFVHNLRSALDYVVRELWEDNGGKTGQAGFPVVQHPKEWEAGGCCNRPIDKVSELIESAITEIKGLQPYHVWFHRDDHPLGWLTRLDNRDKHNKLNLTAYFISHIGTGTSGWWFGAPRSNQSDAGARVTLAKMDMDFKPGIGVTLGKGVAEGWPLWEPYPRRHEIFESFWPPGLSAPLPRLPEFLIACTTGVVSLLRGHLTDAPAWR